MAKDKPLIDTTKLPDFHERLEPVTRKYSDLLTGTVSSSTGPRVFVPPTLDATAFPRTESTFGGPQFRNFCEAIRRVSWLHHYMEDFPSSTAINSTWRIMLEDAKRGRPSRIKPMIAVYLPPDSVRIITTLVPRELLVDRSYKGAPLLYLFLGFCSMDGSFFTTHKAIFGVSAHEQMEVSNYLLNKIIIELIEDRMMPYNLYELQKEAQEVFREIFM